MFFAPLWKTSFSERQSISLSVMSSILTTPVCSFFFARNWISWRLNFPRPVMVMTQLLCSSIRKMRLLHFKDFHFARDFTDRMSQNKNMITNFFVPKRTVAICNYLCFQICYVQVNLSQKLLFLHQLTHNVTTDCSLN